MRVVSPNLPNWQPNGNYTVLDGAANLPQQPDEVRTSMTRRDHPSITSVMSPVQEEAERYTLSSEVLTGVLRISLAGAPDCRTPPVQKVLRRGGAASRDWVDYATAGGDSPRAPG